MLHHSPPDLALTSAGGKLAVRGNPAVPPCFSCRNDDFVGRGDAHVMHEAAKWLFDEENRALTHSFARSTGDSADPSLYRLARGSPPA